MQGKGERERNGKCDVRWEEEEGEREKDKRNGRKTTIND